MSGETDDTWLDVPAETTTKDSDDSWLDTSAPVADDDEWLNIEDANAGKTPNKFQTLVDQCMRGTNRVMAVWGNFVAYRPFNREFDKQTNPRTMERMNMFRASGHMKHLGTYDEVEIYEFQEGSPYYHDGNKAYVVGQNYWHDIRQAAALAGERKWREYHDFIEGMAIAMKGGGRDPAFARTLFMDSLNHIAVAISQLGPGAPTEKEVNEGFLGVRQSRGIKGNHGAILLNSSGLQKVEFSKGKAK